MILSFAVLTQYRLVTVMDRWTDSGPHHSVYRPTAFAQRRAIG